MNICRFCKSEESSIVELKDHVRTAHINEYIEIQRYLGKTDEKLIWAKKIANEGMMGQTAPILK